MSAPTGQQVPTLWHVCGAWLRRATQIIAQSAPALDAMNVFPVSDADTGSNLELTLAGIARAVPAIPVGATDEPPQLDGLVQAAILSAHGNSGAILAEMFTSVCRSLEHDHPSLRTTEAGALLALLLRTVATAARRAVARPVAGTILSVADDTATAAEQAAADHPGDPLAVALAAQTGARDSLARTPAQLQVLASAGVVDAGGQAYSLLVDALVEVLGGPTARPLALDGAAQPRAAQPRAASPRPGAPEEYEVMYALQGATPATLGQLRQRLSELGHSVVVVGDQAMAQVHVHLDDAGSAVEAALGAGRLSGIRVTALPGPVSNERTVISVVAGAGLVEAVTALGGVPLLDGDSTGHDLVALVGQTCGDLVILPNDPTILAAAVRLGAGQRGAGRRVAVIPTVAQVQGLAAMAVHEPTADFDSVVVAMSSAAGHTRHGAVTVAEAVTEAGRWRPGDVLGLVQGDIVEIGDSVIEVAWRVVQRLLSTGGELLSLVIGADAGPSLAPDLTARVRRAAPDLHVEVLGGGQRRYLLLVGLE